jgi:putative adenylate-forming enzyme
MNTFTLLKTKFKHLKSRRLSSEDIREKNLKKFRKLVAFIKERSPWYKRIIAQHRIDSYRCLPDDFPVMTKQDVIENFDEIVTDQTITKKAISDFIESSKNPLDLFRNQYYVLHGSGTSGEIGFFVYSKNDFARGMAHGIGLVNFNLQIKRKRIAFLGATTGHFAAVSMVSISMRLVPKLIFKTKTFEINRPIHQIVEQINFFQPDIIIGYATVIKILAEKQIEGVLNVCPSVVESCAEPLSSTDREFIENTFGCRLLNVYGSTEFLHMGISKPEYGGMYLLEDDLIFEIHSDHTCVTNLFNYTMPLIRYRMEDVLIPVHEDDRILPFTKIQEAIGRREYTIVLTNKYGSDDFINPHAIYQYFIRDLRRFQIQLIDKQSFIFRALLNKSINEIQKNKVLREIKSKMHSVLSAKDMENVSFEIEESEDLPVDPRTGKFRLVLRGNSESVQ